MSTRIHSLRRFSTQQHHHHHSPVVRTTINTISSSPRSTMFPNMFSYFRNSKSTSSTTTNTNAFLSRSRLKLPLNLFIIFSLLCTIPLLLLSTPHIFSLNLAPNTSNHSNLHVTDDDLTAAARRSRPLPKCALENQPAKTFLMVFMGHSGSSAILSELKSHSKIYIEIAEMIDHQETFNTTQALIATRQFFDRGLKMNKIPGFKLRPMHILNSPNEWIKLANEYSTRIIWQYRQNLFKASIGEYATRYLNDTSAVEGLKQNLSREQRCKTGSCRFKIENFEFLHQTVKQKVKSHHAITDAVHTISGYDVNGNGCVREVPYEDYLYDRENTMKDLQRFLGLSYEQTKPSRYKATGDSLCDVVENWDQVCTYFYGCMLWQPMMNDARNKCFCQYTTGPTTYCNL